MRRDGRSARSGFGGSDCTDTGRLKPAAGCGFVGNDVIKEFRVV